MFIFLVGLRCRALWSLNIFSVTVPHYVCIHDEFNIETALTVL